MIFELDFQPLQILDVITLDQENINRFVECRNFSALSFRIHSDACIQTEQNVYRMNGGTLSYFPKDLDYTRTATKDKMIVVHFDAVNYTKKSIEVYTPADPGKMLSLFTQLFDCWNQKGKGYRYQCQSLFYEIFALCHSQFQTAQEESKISAAVNYIRANWNDPTLNISEAAKRSHISEVYFRRLFRQEFGTSPRQYITALRMQNAASLINAGYFSLREVAERSGYADYKYFSVEFKRHNGCSPSVYMYRFGNQQRG